MDSALWTIRLFNLSASFRCSSLFGSNIIHVWKFPSPACATTALESRKNNIQHIHFYWTMMLYYISWCFEYRQLRWYHNKGDASSSFLDLDISSPRWDKGTHTSCKVNSKTSYGITWVDILRVYVFNENIILYSLLHDLAPSHSKPKAPLFLSAYKIRVRGKRQVKNTYNKQQVSFFPSLFLLLREVEGRKSWKGTEDYLPEFLFCFSFFSEHKVWSIMFRSNLLNDLSLLTCICL